MDPRSALIAVSTSSLVVRYAAAFFFVVTAIALAYALYKGAKALERMDKVLADMDEQGVPLMQKAGSTLDGVNANLGNVDEITKDVAGITDKLDHMAGAVESAVSVPARKAAALSAGVQGAVSSFLGRDKPAAGADAPEPAADSAPDEPAAGADAPEPATDPAPEEPAVGADAPEPADEVVTPPADPPADEA